MNTRKLLLAAIAASALGAAAPAFADTEIWVNGPPPAARHEVMPRERAGYVWEPGYYDYRHGSYVWVPGHWIRERRGMYWHPSHWVERDGRWVLERGRWDRERYVENRMREERREQWREERREERRDRDGDGVPNRFDRAPDNPYRR